MKVHHLILYTSLVFSMVICTSPLRAGGGDDHTHAEDKPEAGTVAQKYFSTEVASDKYELLLRYEPITPGKSSQLTLFVSDFETNKPINDAELKITAQEDPSIALTVHLNGNGTYAVTGAFPKELSYSLAVSINGAKGPDLLLLEHIDVGAELPHAHEPSATSWIAGSNWIMVIAALVVGLALGLLFRKRNTRQGKTTLSLILILIGCSIPFQTTVAHGDDDHGQGGGGNVFSNSVAIPKETQFLFDIYTQRVLKGSFTESSHLFGTIVPSPAGHAIVVTPVNGIIKSLKAQVGKPVQAGQVLAVIEQSVDVGTQVGMQSEWNNLAAEYEAAKKEVERLNSISDIAAKRDIDEAKARLQKADTNLALFKGKTGRTMNITAPISGMLGNFNVSIGAAVTSGQTLFTVTNLSTLYVEAQVFDKDAEKIVPDAFYSMECANDNHKTTQIKLLSPALEINTTNQSQKVLFQADNPDGDFKIGEFVNIRVFESTPSRQITLPNSAFTEINGKPVVFIKEAAESYTVSYVQLGHNNGTHTSILKGVEEGERAVINGSYQLKMIYLNQ
jgi:cobalt-zinc-cadmium efflux system membrane fusion protein